MLCSSCDAMPKARSQSHLWSRGTSSSPCGCRCRPRLFPCPYIPGRVTVALGGNRRRVSNSASRDTPARFSAPAFYARSNEAWAAGAFRAKPTSRDATLFIGTARRYKSSTWPFNLTVATARLGMFNCPLQRSTPKEGLTRPRRSFFFCCVVQKSTLSS